MKVAIGNERAMQEDEENIVHGTVDVSERMKGTDSRHLQQRQDMWRRCGKRRLKRIKAQV